MSSLENYTFPQSEPYHMVGSLTNLRFNYSFLLFAYSFRKESIGLSMAAFTD
jgi:hypothetical protein